MSQKITELTTELVTPIVEKLGLELVDVEFVKEGKNWFLRVYIDSTDGIDIEECGTVSEQLSEKLDELDPIEQPYFLEVSSPGVERPLKKPEDVKNAIGKNVNIKLYEPLNGEKVYEGLLKDFDGETLFMEIRVKTQVKKVELPYAKVANARLAVVF
ncbi:MULTISPECIES: ribosome maturation factor RimP [Fictibacillus]|jgi:ribosome maturation factor RimP|uniref:Ribosome maturation factor RimP n=1 Tax=Fictibacillus nanhaiensis TaxID=742169 RepID=A0ABS2ZVF8_9BACL|nr:MULTISPECIES: ribosome maturation factor RimP [Fictibacillus]MBH0155921.1 ribosome maturation factor RimP [Fictibacillus sp. 5RED26]MBH0160945.1 ribosome maturation factor RimP [Fictibacillus sp. 26RED30]MBH0165837.1 ribosome maturation factor RimP [Fictibacillus sp. 7GRE50]MBH0173114.1 ribosome maturation factor RimP [Fictibacillus sp. 23RED33]MBN3555260.1 ribosome maturation factor RimP [Fictibacillus nanhaiensis]